MATSALSDRDIRQRALVPPERLMSCDSIVIGVGAVGRQVALQLAALGVPRLTLIDHDTVEVANLAVQGYWPEDLGAVKVGATAALCRRINPSIDVTAHQERFRRSMLQNAGHGSSFIVFACVDSIATRRFIWQSLERHRALFIDGRMNGEAIRVLTSIVPEDHYYAATLFPEAEAHVGVCTARSTLYAASIAAGMMVSQYAKWLRQLPLDPDLMLNLLSAEMTATSPESPGAARPT
jgi:molybdopterin/thiamine biosynthesis adenylyltransferase